MNEVMKASWASARATRDFICIDTCSGYRATATDPKGKQHLLPPDVSDQDLGVAVLDALANSRFVPPLEQPEEDLDLFDVARIEHRYSEWAKHLMETYGYKTKRALFSEMKHCNLELRQGTITICPTHHRSLEAWGGGGISEENYVRTSSDSPPEGIGAALRLAFTRCT
jgi:hypothetical protein